MDVLRRPILRLAFNRAELALSIGISVSSIDVMVAEGALPPPRKWHSRKMWLVEEVEAYLRELPTVDEGSFSPVPARTFESDKNHSSAKGPGGYPVPGVSDQALQQHYDELGFDPRTMGEADMVRLMGIAEEKWKIGVRASALYKRERAALRVLMRFEVGKPVSWREVSGVSHGAAERLAARGLIEISYSPPETYTLNAAGLAAARSLPSET